MELGCRTLSFLRSNQDIQRYSISCKHCSHGARVGLQNKAAVTVRVNQQELIVSCSIIMIIFMITGSAFLRQFLQMKGILLFMSLRPYQLFVIKKFTQSKSLREGFKKSKWKFKMAFTMKGGGVSRGSRVPHTYFEK